MSTNTRLFLLLLSFLSLTKFSFSQTSPSLAQCNNNYQDSCLVLYASTTDSIIQKKKEEEFKNTWRSCVKDYNLSFSNKYTDTINQEIILSQISSKLILLNFWSVGCPPCMTELQALNKIRHDYAKTDVMIYSFCISSVYKISRFNILIDFPIIPNATNFFLDFGIKSYPETLILDENKKPIEYILGASYPNSDETYQKLKKIIDLHLYGKTQ